MVLNMPGTLQVPKVRRWLSGWPLREAALGWPPRTTVADTVRAAAPYLREALVGEAVLTIGGPLHEHAEGLIDGVVSVGPLECMPLKLAETQLQHAAEKTGLLALTIPVNGDPVDPAALDSFVYDVHARFRQRRAASSVEGRRSKVKGSGPRAADRTW